MVQEIATKYRRLIIETDEYLRKHHSDGTRVHVKYRSLAEEMNVSVSSMSSVLGFLGSIKGSGLHRLKVGGEYEYVLPVGYPIELVKIKENLKQVPMRSRMANPYVRADVIKYFKNHPNVVQTISEVCEEVEGNRSSISSCMYRLSQKGWLEACTELGTGIYIYRSSTTEDPGPEQPDEPVTPNVQAAGVSREKEAERQIISGRDATAPPPKPGPGVSDIAEVYPGARVVVPASGPYPAQVVPSPARVAQAIQAKKPAEVDLKKPAWDEAIQAYIEANYPPNEKLYEYVQDTPSGKIVLKNRMSGRVGIWKELA